VRAPARPGAAPVIPRDARAARAFLPMGQGLDAKARPRRNGSAADIIRLLDLDLANLDAPGAAALIAQRPADAPFAYVVTPNADHFVRIARNPALRPVYTDAWIRLLDSRVVARAARLLGLQTPRVAPGSDLAAVLFARHLDPDQPVTIVGLRAAYVARLARWYRLTNVAHYDPPAGFEHDAASFREAIAFVLAHPARLTFLAVGSPRQEMLAHAIAATGRACGTGLCVGAALEFLSGGATRAPGWMRFAGLEWLFRLTREPRRLAQRYLRDDPLIFRLLLDEKFAGVGSSDDDAGARQDGATIKPSRRHAG
jgi:N-acetylglucosaminyldiphosphoundecaprenol N-acetyl-beta-D-mannosaminyltransferase